MMVSPSVLTSFLVFFSGLLARPATMVSATDLACPSELENMERLNFRANLFYAIVPGVGEESGILCARYEYRGVGFVAMAVSESGSMVGSEAIIGVSDGGDDGTVMKYFLGGKNADLVQPVEEAKQTLMDTSITQDDDTTNPMTIMTFTKYLKEEDEREILENGMNQFIFSYGNDHNRLAYHKAKGKFEIDFKVTKAPTEAPVTASPTVSTPPTMAPTQSPSMAPTPAPTKSPVVTTMPPTESPTMAPTKSPTMAPTTSPTMTPTKSPTMSPVAMAEVPPTGSPTASPTSTPTKAPVVAVPTLSPVAAADSPPTISPVMGAVTDAPVMGAVTDAPVMAAVTESPVKAGAFAMRGGSVMVGVAATVVAAWML